MEIFYTGFIFGFVTAGLCSGIGLVIACGLIKGAETPKKR